MVINKILVLIILVSCNNLLSIDLKIRNIEKESINIEIKNNGVDVYIYNSHSQPFFYSNYCCKIYDMENKRLILDLSYRPRTTIPNSFHHSNPRYFTKNSEELQHIELGSLIYRDSLGRIEVSRKVSSYKSLRCNELVKTYLSIEEIKQLDLEIKFSFFKEFNDSINYRTGIPDSLIINKSIFIERPFKLTK